MAHGKNRHPHSTPVLIRAIIDNSQGKEKNLTEDDKEALKDFWEHNNGVSQQEILYNLSVGHFPHLYGDWAAPSKENTQPLWKVLNEQRTQGQWNQSTHDPIQNAKDPIFWHHDILNQQNTMRIGKGISTDPKKATANAAYTALAVNNLHILAEILGLIIKAHGKGENINIEILAAKEALNSIS